MGYATERFAKRLKQIREASGLTQEQFAKELKVSRGTISYYEKGERTPDIEFLNSLYEYFECTIPFNFLLGDTNNIKEKHRNMYDFYGLTDNACDRLDRHPEIGHIISAILDHEDFFVLSQAYEYIIQQYKEFNECQIGYISYLITDCLNGIIYDSLITTSVISLTDEEKKKSQILYEKSKKELEELQKICKHRHEELNEHRKQLEAEDIKKIMEENAVRHSILDKIYDAFSEATYPLELKKYS